MTDFADDQVSIERKRSRVNTNRQNNEQVIRQLMSTMPGRRWVYNKLEECHMYESGAYLDGDNAVNRTYFAAGERNFGLRLLADVMRVCPSEYVLALQENSQEEPRARRNQNRNDTSDNDGGAKGNGD